MSEATEIARAESVPDDDEAAEEEETQPVDGDGETPPDDEPAPPPIDSVKLTKALDREHDRHEGALKKIMGDDFEMFDRCPLCAVSPAGYVLPFANLPEEAQDEIREGVNQYVAGGGIDLERFSAAADMSECEVCHGEGLVRSGSKHPEHVLEVCNPCRGNGWRTKLAEVPAPVQLPQAPAATTTIAAPPYVDVYGNPSWISPDQFGRPHGAADYGQPLPTPGTAG